MKSKILKLSLFIITDRIYNSELSKLFFNFKYIVYLKALL